MAQTAAVASRTYVGPPPTRGSSPKLEAVPELLWPRNVPSRHDSVKLMFEPKRLPEALREPTLQLMNVFLAQGLAQVPDEVDFEQWHLALATTFRLQVAVTLAKDAKVHDEPALQQLFVEAAETRDWLLSLTFDQLFVSAPQVLSLRGLLQVTWDEVLKAAPEPEDDEPRPPARTGNTGIQKYPSPPPGYEKKKEVTQTTYKLPEKKKKSASSLTASQKALMAGAALALIAFAVAGPRPARVETNGAPQGWVLAGSYQPGPATVMAAGDVMHSRDELDRWLEELAKQGVVAEPHGPDEWILTQKELKR